MGISDNQELHGAKASALIRISLRFQAAPYQQVQLIGDWAQFTKRLTNPPACVMRTGPRAHGKVIVCEDVDRARACAPRPKAT